MTWTLIQTIMSGSLYLLSYSLCIIDLEVEKLRSWFADLGIAPKYYGHEPSMLLLHQPAYTLSYSIYIYFISNLVYIIFELIYISIPILQDTQKKLQIKLVFFVHIFMPIFKK